MEQMLKIIEISVTFFLGIVGLYFAYNFRRQVKQKTTKGRIESYSKLWEIMKTATPMRDRSWHEGEFKGPLNPDERKQLYKEFTNWYYEGGNGMYLGDSTRRMFIHAWHNLICPDQELRPSTLFRVEKGQEKMDQKKRGLLSIKQLSILRHRMRADLEVYGTTFFEELTPEDESFLEFCGENWRRKPWVGANEMTLSDSIGKIDTLPKIGEVITTERALELCKYFKLDYLTERINSNPGSYKEWKFDGISVLDDKFAADIFHVDQNALTLECALPHDLRYGYGESGNKKERKDADWRLRRDLLTKAKMSRFSASILYLAVRIGGAELFRLSYSWAFARKA